MTTFAGYNVPGKPHYFVRLAEKIERGIYVPCRSCSTSLGLAQLLEQYEMCDEHWTDFHARRWPS
jgi:hypothetical protein